MGDTAAANSVLINYIESLLWDDDQGATATPPELSGHRDEADEAVGKAADSNTMRIVFFKVAGIPLAISFQDVAEIIDIKRVSAAHRNFDAGITIAMFRNRDRDIYAIDTSEIIFPAGHPVRRDSQQRVCGHIVMLAGNGLGLMCDEVGAIVDLDRQEVEWRVQRQTRSWLAGMVKGYNHALLDIRELIRSYDLGRFAGPLVSQSS